MNRRARRDLLRYARSVARQMFHVAAEAVRKDPGLRPGAESMRDKARFVLAAVRGWVLADEALEHARARADRVSRRADSIRRRAENLRELADSYKELLRLRGAEPVAEGPPAKCGK